MKTDITSKPRRFIMFHKPKGTIVTLSDEKNRKTVYDILPRFVLEDRWIPVGRLDRDSRGLLLFTREGGLSDLLTQPGKFSKFYEVWIRGRITEEQLQQTLQGVKTPIDMLQFKGIKTIGYAGPKTRLMVELTEGKNRHIRRVFGALQDPQSHTPLKVLDLKRVQLGTVKLDIPSSNWRFLTHEEENALINVTSRPKRRGRKTKR
ncbi:MAG: rRNA pseudouridine synthase [Candidatus Scalindua sp.]|jgi:23S rRNA pseudouridine2605 synthase|nr:rRNA pseudouridine synthase [Candidatus Scalindua sp.]MBT5307489.1 rRNA pseudouridine synthase [Candidatus Scalindua sp.]MBT6052229.1 rRNA pseudouridine synthase [Candidatus Scalindua sp.]MBT6228137.1 rRNA pseudouridine synthase [Candidatus Scalindua sp.]MBT6561531.1 rRNA pseudouridine synthase [Candidatus Scalindua sp.]